MSSQAELKAILSPTAALAIPGGQAILTGAAVGVIGGSLAMLTGGDPLAIGALSCGLGTGAGLLFGLSWWRSRVQAILGELRPVTAAVSAETVRLEVYQAETSYPAASWLDIPVRNETLLQALDHLASGGDLSMSAMVGPGRLSRYEFSAVRDALIAGQLAYWLNPRAHSQGCALTLAGRHAVGRWARLGEGTPEARSPLALPGDGWQRIVE